MPSHGPPAAALQPVAAATAAAVTEADERTTTNSGVPKVLLQHPAACPRQGSNITFWVKVDAELEGTSVYGAGGASAGAVPAGRGAISSAVSSATIAAAYD